MLVVCCCLCVSKGGASSCIKETVTESMTWAITSQTEEEMA